MKTFVVISDSHNRKNNFYNIQPLFEENNYIVHLGDGSTDMREIFSMYPDKTYILKGNCDFFYGQDELVIEAEGVRIFCCHGHKYGVKSNLYRLAERAKELDCEVALYGHTHNADRTEVDGVICINPGSVGAYSGATYCYLVIHKGKVTETFVNVDG